MNIARIVPLRDFSSVVCPTSPKAVSPKVRWCATVGLASLLLAARAWSQDPCLAPAGLVSCWSGEGNAFDAFGSNNGALRGGATYTSGKVGQAFSFDGVSGTVVVPDSLSLRLTNQITIEAWIRPRIIRGDQAIVSKVSVASGNYGYQFNLTQGNVLAGAFNSPGQGWPSSALLCPVPIVAGAWCHVAWTYDQSVMKLYFNGQLVGSKMIGPQVIATSSCDLRISGADDHVFFNGEIDEASVYNVALSAGQIQAIYNAGSAGKLLNRAVEAPRVSTSTSYAGGPTPTVSTYHDSVFISWPASATGYVLESCDDLFLANWAPVAAIPVTNGNQVNVTLPISASRRPYRLRHP
jgi:hypothetical protein